MGATMAGAASGHRTSSLASDAASQGTIRYVTPTGAGSACTTVAPCALRTAVSLSTDGDEIRVAQGTYTTAGSGAVITLTHSFTLTGGYSSANWTLPPDRDGRPTRLDGQNSRRIIHIATAASPTIQGFFIENGSATNGGGIYNTSGSPLIRHNRIHGHTSLAGNGGAIYDDGAAIIENNEIYDNQTTGGGQGAGIAIADSSGPTEIRYNRIYSNTAPGNGNGGGILIRPNASAVLEANTLHHNTASNGGGIYAFNGGSLTMYSNLFYDNQATGSSPSGYGGGAVLSINATLWNNTFADNTATLNGGGIAVFSAVVTIHNTIIAFNSGGTEDGLYNGGTVSGGYNNIFNDTISANVSFNNTLTGNPGFINQPAGDYHLNGILPSPNINAGDPATPTAVDQDMDDQPRPYGPRQDVGADEYLPNVPNFTLTPDFLALDVDRGTNATFSHVVRNTGTVADTYSFNCSNSLGWTVITCPASVNLSPGGSANVNTTVQIPSGAVALSQANTTILATSQFSPTLTHQAVVQTTVKPIPGIAFTPNYTQTVLPGDIITLTHILTNTGDAADTFTVQIVPGSQWGQLLPSNQFQMQIAAGASRLVLLRVTVPPFAPAGLADVAQIHVQSGFDTAVTALVTDTTIAEPTIGTRYVAVSGSDTNNNCTQLSTPCATIAQAIGQASFADEVYIGAGTYHESGLALNDTIYLEGGWSNGFLTQGEPGDTIINGGGVTRIFDIAPGAAVRPSLHNLTLLNGSSAGPGGAIQIGSYAQPQLNNLIIQQNQGTLGGAIYANSNALVIIKQTTFMSNTATNSGGAVYGNNATISIQQSSFLTNTAPSSAANQGNGGAVYLAGGLLLLQNDLFQANQAQRHGGAVYLNSGTVTFGNNTLVGNTAVSGNGGAFYHNGSTNVTIVNTLLVQNTAVSGGALYAATNGALTLRYSDLWQNSTPELFNVTNGPGNLATDPLFADPLYRLSRGSGVLDHGDPNTTLTVDFEDDFRPADNGYDMGYDELAGCRAQRVGITAPFGSIQEAINATGGAVPPVIRVTGICRGVLPIVVGSQTLSQTVILTQTMVIQGGWNSDFSLRTDEATYIDPEGNGRAFYITGNISPTLDSLIIVNGDATGLGGGPNGEDAGGGIYNRDSDPVLQNMSILTSTATLGGGFYNHSGTAHFQSQPDADPLTNTLGPASHIGGNTAVSGGGLYNHTGRLQIDSLRIYSNTATNGGGLYNAGPLSISNTVIFSNTAVSGNGGGIYNQGAAPLYWHLTLYGNTASGSGNTGRGGGFYNASGNPLIRNAIFDSNHSQTNSGPAIYVASGTPDIDYNYYHSFVGTAVVGANPGANSILTNLIPPGLIDAPHGNFHLQDNALSAAPAAIDRGDPLSPILTDFDGEPRPSNQGPDIGADEVVGCLVELNGQLYGSIQAALNAAAPGDTILVAGMCSGVSTYSGYGGGNYQCADSNGNIVTALFLNKSVHLQGGWDTTFTDQSSTTILNAQQLGHVLTIAPGVTSTIEGFDIINGLVTGANGNGAGICIDDAAPIIQSNRIYSNTATNGGAIYIANSSDVATIQNNFIYSNTATNGGAIYNALGNNALWHNTLYSNTATSTGGGFYVAASSPLIRSNIVMSHTATTAAGAYGAAGSTPSLGYNDFYGQANNFGGTIVNGGVGHISADPQFKDLTALDFSIVYTSPVADVGDPTLPITGDFELDIRPSHQGFDIGADEVGGCYAHILSDPTVIYGSVQTAIDAAPAGDTVEVNGTCLGVNTQTLIGSGNVVTQALFINKDLTLNGFWPYKTAVTATIKALNQGRALFIGSGNTVTVTRILLRDGNATTAGLINGRGGGIWNDGELTLPSVRLQQNTADLGGGIYNDGGLILSGSLITANVATNGAGLYNNILASGSAELIDQNRFIDNRATQNGGGIYQASGTLFIDGNEFSGNQAINGGAIYLNSSNQIDIWNNFLTDNIATSLGGGLYNANANGRIWHNTFIGNTGGALYSSVNASDDIRSNIIDSNFGVGIRTSAPGPIIDYNNVISNAPNYAGTAVAGPNDISALPLYIDPFLQDYHLQEFSPGVDVADPSLSIAGLDHDYDGHLRPTNSGPDMGADEINTCYIRVINPIDTQPYYFGVFQDAINFAESFAPGPFPKIEVARGACRGALEDPIAHTWQVGYIREGLHIIGSLRRSDFTDPGDYYNPEIGALSTSIDAQDQGRALVIDANAPVTISQLALVNGNAYNANDSNDNGGGTYFAGTGHVYMSVSETCENYAENGGGSYAPAGADVYISGASTGSCWVALFDDKDKFLEWYDFYAGNEANTHGGGLYISSGANIEVVNHGYGSNQASNGNGGAVYNAGPTRIINGIYMFNDADGAAPHGNGGAIYNTAALELYHNTMRDNFASGNGGGIYHAGGGLTVNSSIVYANTSSGSTGGGLFSAGGSVALDYNLFNDNTPDDSNVGIGTHAINSDPRFRYFFSAALSRYSPAIDQADPTLLEPGALGWPDGINFDAGNVYRPDGGFLGSPVIHNGLHGLGSDIGADEYWKEFACEVVPASKQTTVLPGDVVTYSVGIYNVGNPNYRYDPPFTHGYTDTFTVTVSSQTQGWSTLEGGNQQLITLDWQSWVTKVLTVTVPTTASLGLQERTAVNCQSGSIPARQSTGIFMTNVGLVNSIEIGPAYTTHAYPGDVITFTHFITNNGNGADTFQLIPNAGAAGLSTAVVVDPTGAVITTPINLDPSQTITALLRVNILDTAPAGSTANPGLIVRSTTVITSQAQIINQIIISPTAGTRYVAVNGGNDSNNNCLVATSPCATIQHAVDEAAGGDEILVAGGLYTEHLTRTINAEMFDQNLYLYKSVTIRGGYNTADNFTTSQPITNAVILDGELARRVIYIENSGGTTPHITLSGLFILNGRSYVPGVMQNSLTEYGAGIYNSGANLTITGTWFISHSARYGGALYHADGNLLVASSVFAHNDTGSSPSGLAGQGGGIHIVNGTAVLSNNTFDNNAADPDGSRQCCIATPFGTSYGGAVYQLQGDLSLVNNIFAHSFAEQGSAVYISTTLPLLEDYNLYFANELIGGMTNFITGTHSLSGDPVFVDDYYHISALSAAKEQGTAVANVPADFEGDPRPQGLSYDMGADERVLRTTFDFTPTALTQIALPDQPVIFTHWLTNTGDITNTYTVTHSSTAGVPGFAWDYTVTPAVVTLNSGESTTVTLVITGSIPGDVNTTQITATPTAGGPRQVIDTTIISSTAGVAIGPDMTGSAAPGTQISYQHTLTNTGNGYGNFYLRPLTATLPAWTVTVNPTQTGFIPAGSAVPFTVTITVPPATPANTVHQVPIEAYAMFDPTARDLLTDTTTALAAFGLTLTPNYTTTVPDAFTQTYVHTLLNVGNITDTITLNVTGNPATWSITIQPTLVSNLIPGTAVPVTITLIIPAHTGGQQHIATITAVSSNPQVTAVATDTTTIQTLPDVQLDPDQTQIVNANTTVTYIHTLTNLGNITDTFTLDAHSSLGWLTNFSSGTTLAPAASATVLVTVTVPAGQSPGTADTTIITATSSINPAVFDIATDTTRVRQQHGLIFTPDHTGTAPAGSQIAYTHLLTNTGNGPDSFALNAHSGQGWLITLPPTPINLNPGSTASVIVTLTIPAGSGGQIDVLQLTASSVISPAFTATVVNTTTVSGTGSYGVTLAPDNQSNGQPGQTITYTHTLTNSGTLTDTYDLTAVSTQGWFQTISPTTVLLTPGASQPVTVTVLIDPAATNGQIDATTLTATSQGNPAVQDTAVDTTIAQLPANGVLIEPDNNGQGAAGTIITYTHTVTNIGSVTNSFQLTAQSSLGWAVVVTPTQIATLPVSGTAPVTVTVTIPGTAVPATVDYTTVVVTAITDPTITDLAVNQTTVSGIPPVYGVDIYPNNSTSATVRTRLNYQHTILNTGNITDTFTLSAHSSQNWTISGLPPTLTLGPGQSEPVTLQITVPANATIGLVDVTTVTATSTATAVASDSATDTTTVIPSLQYLPVIYRTCATTGIDLVVTSLSVQPNPPVSGQPATISITIHNQGTVDMDPLNNFFLDFYVDHTPAILTPGDLQWGVQARLLPAGATTTYTKSYTFNAGAHQLWAQVDTDNSVNECPQEGNNILGPITINPTGINRGGQPIAPTSSGNPRPTPTAILPRP